MKLPIELSFFSNNTAKTSGFKWNYDRLFESALFEASNIQWAKNMLVERPTQLFKSIAFACVSDKTLKDF